MSPGVVRALYNLALPPMLLASLPGQWLKMRRRGGTARDLGERLGHYDRPTSARLASLTKPWWIHAVSVGEVLVAAKAIAAVRAMRPETPLVLSTTTTTGHHVAVRELPADVPVIHNPVDLTGAVRRAFEAVRPGRLILVEAEVWPNLVHIARATGMTVSLINARLSPRSERRYLAARSFTGPIFGQLDRVLVPDPEDVDRWAAIGVRREAIRVTGSLKHDYDGVPEDPRTRAFAGLLASVWGASIPPILLAASTHPGEEILLARRFLDVRAAHPALRLLVAPRHVERSAEVAADLASLGLTVCRRSEVEAAPPAARLGAGPEVLVIDTTGELRAWQTLATVVIIGKSFLSAGGQNPVEALMAGRPVVTGPHMENFASLMRSLLAHEAIIQVRDDTMLPAVVSELLASPVYAARQSDAARVALSAHQGAARRTAEYLFDLG